MYICGGCGSAAAGGGKECDAKGEGGRVHQRHQARGEGQQANGGEQCACRDGAEQGASAAHQRDAAGGAF